LERAAIGAPRVLRVAQAMRRASSRLAALMNDLAGWVFILCAGFITLDVVFRNFGGFSSSATTEITSYMLAFGIAWGLAHALAARAHIRVDVLVNKLPIAWRQYLHALALAVLTTLALFLAWCAWTLVDESVFFNATDTSALAVPLVIPQGLWAIGISMLAMQVVLQLFEVACLLWAGDAQQIDRLLGARGYEEETQEALEAVGITPPGFRRQGNNL
jgi:TRAP-type C4-dicarboxylate transport system permease small subunit